MELSPLKYFVTVAQTQHLTRAAEILNISQPALSKAIGRLEEEIGTPLFDRTPNRIVLNHTGIAFLEQVQEALRILEQAEESARLESGGLIGRVGIMTSCSGLIQPAIREFLLQNREIHYQQYRYNAGHILEQMEGGIVDLAVTSRTEFTSQCIWQPLVKDELYVITAPQHPFSGRESISFRELATENLIINNNLLSTHNIVTEAYGHFGLKPKIAYELNNPPLTELLLQENRGIAFVPGLPTEQKPGGSAGMRKIRVEGSPFTYELGILKLKSHRQRPAATIFEKFLLEWYENAEHKPNPESRTNIL